MSPEQYEERVQLVREYAILEFFEFKHLPEHLREVSRPFCDLAFEMARTLPKGAETSAGLRKLLEAKDCAVRARVAKPQERRISRPVHFMGFSLELEKPDREQTRAFMEAMLAVDWGDESQECDAQPSEPLDGDASEVHKPLNIMPQPIFIGLIEQHQPKPSQGIVINIDPGSVLGSPEGVRQMVKMFEQEMHAALARHGISPDESKTEASAPVSHLVNDDGTVGD